MTPRGLALLRRAGVPRDHVLVDLYSDDACALLDALDDPLVSDAVLFEGGAFAEFVAVRGALLPDDERLLAEQ